MKEIKDMNLAELCEVIEPYTDVEAQVIARLREIHEQTRWIDVEERRPVFSDCNGLGGVETLYANVTGFAEIRENGTIWAESLITSNDREPEIKAYKSHDYLPFTHWRRIVLPDYKLWNPQKTKR
jgi:hypothetical protein